MGLLDVLLVVSIILIKSLTVNSKLKLLLSYTASTTVCSTFGNIDLI